MAPPAHLDGAVLPVEPVPGSDHPFLEGAGRLRVVLVVHPGDLLVAEQKVELAEGVRVAAGK